MSEGNLRCLGKTKKGKDCNNMGIYKTNNATAMFCRHHVPKNEEKCVICLCELYDEYMIPCGHLFHSKCILKWMKRHNSCPICRKDILTNVRTTTFAELLNQYEGETLEIVIDIALVSNSTEHFETITAELCI